MPTSIRRGIDRWAFRTRVKDRDFTVISNNCWGAEVYKDLGIPYLTPFVGLYLHAPCYLKMLQDLDKILREPIAFVEESRYSVANQERLRMERPYPIGLLGQGVEIHFLHYSTQAEARDKWNRRLDRAVWDRRRLFVKFCDRDLCTPDLIREFDRLDFPNKVCFTATQYPELRSTVWIPECQNEPHVMDGVALYGVCKRHFQLAAWLNEGGLG